MSGAQTVPEGLTMEQALDMITNIQAQVQEVDVAIGEINARFFVEWNPWNERRTKLMAAWQAIYDLLPYLPSEFASATAASLEVEAPPDVVPAKPKKERVTPRSVMLEVLRTAIGPVSQDVLIAAVHRAGLQPKMTGAELVYQTLYAAKKAGHPIDRTELGSWFWVRDNAA